MYEFSPGFVALADEIAPDYITVAYGTNDWSMGKKEAWHKNKKYVRKAITAFVVTSLVTTALQSVFDAFRDYDEDDKDEEYWAKLLMENFLLNMSFLNKIPYLNNIFSIISGFTPSRVDTDWMGNSVKGIKEIGKLFAGEGSSHKAIVYILKTLSDMSGIAGYNLYRDL